MRQRLLGTLLALLLLAVACGSPDDEGEAVLAERTPTPAPDETPQPETPEPEADVEEPASPEDTDEPSEPQGEPEPEPDPDPEPAPDHAGVNRPTAGQYVYDLSGTRDTPLDAVPHEYSDDARAYVDLHREGDTYTSERRSNEDDTEETTRTRWTATEVLLEYLKVTIPEVASFECTLDPPVVMLRLPLEAGAYPHQSWSGDDCSGESSIEVIGEEEITDAAGRTWHTWRIESTTSYRFGTSLSGESDGTTWFGPDLGTTVKSDTENNGSFNDSSFTTHQITLLREHP